MTCQFTYNNSFIPHFSISSTTNIPQLSFYQWQQASDQQQETEAEVAELAAAVAAVAAEAVASAAAASSDDINQIPTTKLGSF